MVPDLFEMAHLQVILQRNKARYTASLVAWWASGVVGQCWRKSLEHLGRSSGLKNAEKVKREPTDQPTDRLTDRHSGV